jgi:hypothetical protein
MEIMEKLTTFTDLINNGEEFWNYNYLWAFTNLNQ